jgi:uncharacterized membrane protein
MPAMKKRDIEARFSLLEERVFQIELRLGPVTSATPIDPPVIPPIEAPNSLEVPKIFVESPAPLPTESEPALAMPTPVPLPVAAQLEPQSTLPYATPTLPAPPIQGALERMIGLKGAGWAGAIALVIGAAFGVKFIYDKHWFGQVPPAVWLGALFVSGMGLIGLGEVIYRRIHAIPAASVFAAGIATLFLAGYVGQAYYDLYSPGTALFLMAAAALVGALVAMRGNLVSIAVLSHVGANIAPLLVGSRGAPLESFLVYLLALQMVALTLSDRGRSKKWWTLRALSLMTTSLWIAGTGLRPGQESLVLGFCVLYALLYHGELILSATRPGNETAETAGRSAVPRSDAISFCLLVTASLTAIVLWATRDLGAPARGVIILGMATACAFTGFALSRALSNASGLRRQIGLAHRIAAVALVVLAVPVACSGLQAEMGWALLAIAFAAAGVRTQSSIARTAGMLTWIVAVAHLAVATFLPAELGGHRAVIWFSLFGTAITRDAILAFGLSLGGQVVAGLSTRHSSNAGRSPLILSALAALVWIVAAIQSLPPLAATAWIVEYAWLLVAAEALVPELRFSLQAAAIISVATLKWLLVDTLADRLSSDWSPANYRPVLNPMMGIGLLLCASMLTLWFIRRKQIWRALRNQDEPPAGSMSVVISVVVALLLWAVTLEIDRVAELMQAAGSLHWPLWQAKQLGWTIAWAIAATIAFIVLRLRQSVQSPLKRWGRLLPQLITLLAVKYLTIDTTLWRMLGPPANVAVLANLQAVAGAVVFASLAILLLLPIDEEWSTQEKLCRIAGLLASLVLLWMGSIEIDRYFAAIPVFNGAVRPEQVALSIFWAIYAAACVLLGFRLRAAILRYIGLGLLGATLLKVVLIDMSQVQTGYRILSFMGLGALLLATSVLYGKFGPRLLREEDESDSQVSIG